MHCKLDIEKAVIKTVIKEGSTKNIKPFSDNSLLVNKKDFKAEGQTFKIAESKSKELNEKFGDKITFIKKVTDGHEIIINPSEALIDDYYDGYIKTQGILARQETGIDRFGDSNPSFNKAEESLVKSDNESTLKDKYFKDSNETNSLDVLDKIAKSNHGLSPLAKRFANYAKHNNVKVVLDDVINYPLDPNNPQLKGSAYYDPNKNEIHIARYGKFSKHRIETVLLHEIFHSLSKYKLKDGSQVSKDFEKLYKYALEQLGNKTDAKLNDYALLNKDEFFVALFTDPVFIKKLTNTKASNGTKYTNLFTEIIDYLLGILNIGKTSSLYEEAFAVASHVINDFAESSKTMEDSIKYDNETPAFSKEEGKKEIPKPTFETQYVFFKRRINTLEKELSRISDKTDEYKIKSNELKAVKDRFEKATSTNDEEEYTAMGNEHLDWVENLIKYLPDNPDKHTINNLVSAFEILNTFGDFTDLRDRSAKLRKQLFPYIVKHNLQTINNYNTSVENITEEMVDGQIKDEKWSVKSFGSLLDIVNYIGRTIGSVIKAAQNKASTNNKIIEHKVQQQVDKLSEYAKANNTTLEKIYDMFLQEGKHTLVLAQRYNLDGTLNDNYRTIQDTPELKEFYDFYQKTLKDAESILPYKVGKYYVLNKVKTDFKTDLKNIIPSENYLFDSFISNKDLISDSVPDMFRANIPAEKKFRDLGSGLLQFAAYANNHNELSNALPEVRLLQEQLKYKQTSSGHIEDRTFIKASNPKESVKAKDSNVFNMVNTVINMQIKGEMKENKTAPINIKPIKNKEGEIIGYKQVHIEDVIDKGLRYNSLLRIGFSPITAMANVIFGDISNFIEAVGGRFFNVKQAHQATGIFFKQINYTSTDKSSNLYKWLEKLNPLQELADYDIGENLIANRKKLSKEKTLELMYSMQKKGELYLQSRTMIAMLIHDGYINEKGENLSKWNNITELEASKLSDKIQRLNQQIHGRYSQREAATLQQSVWYRMAIQFKKWIPSAIEQRFGDKKYDNRLGVEIEGRYKTMANLLFSKQVLTNLNKMIKGELSPLEMYNMKKTLIEATLLAATLLTYAGLHGGDDDKDKRKKAFLKTSMTLLNRASGDLIFFYSPGQVLHTMSNVAPLIKTTTDILGVINNIPHAFYDDKSQYKSGSHKNSNKFYTKLANVIPGIKPIEDINRLISENSLEELGSKNFLDMITTL